MKITLSNQESERFFFDALCNGLCLMSGYGLELTYDESSYKKAKKTLTEETPDHGICYEDVLMQILRQGDSLTMVDVECEGAYTSTITLSDVHDRVQRTDAQHLLDAINGNDDGYTADAIIQQVFFNETIFG